MVRSQIRTRAKTRRTIKPGRATPSKLDLLSKFQVVVGTLVSISTIVIGWQAYQISERTSESNERLGQLERAQNADKFDFERMRDVYDRTEKYLDSNDQSVSRGRVLVVLINSLPDQQVRSQLLAVVVQNAKDDIVATDAAKVGVQIPAPPNSEKIAPIDGKPGQFSGELKVSMLSNGRSVKLEKPFSFTDSGGTKWTVPEGAIVDGASIPPSLAVVMGEGVDSRFRSASVLFDYYASTRERSAVSTRRMFYEALQASGLSNQQSKIAYLAVSRFGPAWE